MGLAIHNYHTVNDCFPPGGLVVRDIQTADFNFDGSPSAFVRMLHSLEQQALYNAVNWDFGFDYDSIAAVINSTVSLTRLNTFVCPSDTAPSWLGTGSSPLNTTTAPGEQLLRLARLVDGVRGFRGRARRAVRHQRWPSQWSLHFGRPGHRAPRHQ
jgi:hypothetical protein